MKCSVRSIDQIYFLSVQDSKAYLLHSGAVSYHAAWTEGWGFFLGLGCLSVCPYDVKVVNFSFQTLAWSTSREKRLHNIIFEEQRREKEKKSIPLEDPARELVSFVLGFTSFKEGILSILFFQYNSYIVRNLCYCIPLTSYRCHFSRPFLAIPILICPCKLIQLSKLSMYFVWMDR